MILSKISVKNKVPVAFKPKVDFNFWHGILLCFFSAINFVLVYFAMPLAAFSQTTPASTTTNSSPQKVNDFYLTNYKENGLQDWEVRGKEAVVYDKRIDIDKMDAKYFSSNDTVSVKSQKASLNKENMDVSLEKDVYIESQQGATLSTDSLDWDRTKNIVSTDDWVKAAGQTLNVTAQGMTADTVLKKIDFEQNVKTVITDEKGKAKPTNINCTGPLKIEYTKGRAVFNKNVSVDGENGKLFCDKATAFFDVKNKKIVKIVAVGHVKILKDDNVTFARKATYFAKGERIILEGRPKVLYFPKDGDKGPKF